MKFSEDDGSYNINGLKIAKAGVSPGFAGKYTTPELEQVINQTPPEDAYTSYKAPITPAPVAAGTSEMPMSVSPAEAAPVAQPQAPQASPYGGMAQYESGLRQEVKLAEEQGIKQAAMYDGMQRQMEAQQKERADREAQKQQEYDRHYADIQQSQDQLSRMQPQDFWADKSTGTKVVAGLSMMLGALGGAMDGTGANQGADAIDKVIERDLKMQMMKRDIAKEGVQGKQNLFQMRMGQYKDKDLAEQAVRSDMLQGVELQIKKMQAGSAGPQAKAKLNQMLGEIKMKREAANAELAGKIAEKQMERMDKRQGQFVPALEGFALDDKGAQSLRDMSATVANTNQSVDELLKILGTSNKSLSPELAAQAQAIKGTLTGSLRTFLVGPGAVTEYEQKLLDSIVADPTKAFQLDSKAKATLVTLKRKVNDAFKNMAKAQGLNPAEQKTINTTAR
jgi:hypothetical protein